MSVSDWQSEPESPQSLPVQRGRVGSGVGADSWLGVECSFVGGSERMELFESREDNLVRDRPA